MILQRPIISLVDIKRQKSFCCRDETSIRIKPDQKHEFSRETEMKKLFFVFMTIMLPGLILGCAEDSAPAEPRSVTSDVLADQDIRNAVEIRNLTPDSLVEGEDVTLTFDVAYSLTEHTQGVINIGINAWSPDSYTFVADKAVVTEGAGKASFSISVTPVKWDDPSDFKLYASLSEYPHASSWTPLADDTEVLEVAAAPVEPRTHSATSAGQQIEGTTALGAQTCFENTVPGSVYCIEF